MHRQAAIHKLHAAKGRYRTLARRWGSAGDGHKKNKTHHE